MTAEEAYLRIVEGWLREWRTVVFPRGAIDDLCERITMVMQEAADEIERLRLYKEKNESLLIAAAGEQQAEVEQLRGSAVTIGAFQMFPIVSDPWWNGVLWGSCFGMIIIGVIWLLSR